MFESLTSSLQKVFSRYSRPEDFNDFLQHFSEGRSLEVSETMPTASYTQHTRNLAGLSSPMQRLASGGSPAVVASAMEFILEGLHLHKKLNKKVVEGEISYWG